MNKPINKYRRKFIIRLGAFLSTTPLALFHSGKLSAATKNNNKIIAGISDSDWKKITVIQEHLLPSEPGSPGAKEIHASRYLQFVLNEPDTEKSTAAILLQGLNKLEIICKKTYGQSFNKLSNSQRDTALKQLEQTADGFHWLNILLDYLMEALLTDPVYGGNPNGIGWQWLHHQPGFPRPGKALKGRYL